MSGTVNHVQMGRQDPNQRKRNVRSIAKDGDSFGDDLDDLDDDNYGVLYIGMYYHDIIVLNYKSEIDVGGTHNQNENTNGVKNTIYDDDIAIDEDVDDD